MKNFNIIKFLLIGTTAATIFLFFVIVPTALAVSETRYYRSDTYTVNGLNAYQIMTSQSATGLTDFVFTVMMIPGCPMVTWFADIIKRDAAGTEAVLGSTIAPLYGQYNGYQSATWAAPQTALSPTDAIEVVEKLGTYQYVPYANRIWITPQLNASQLNAATWTFVRYTYYTCACMYGCGGGPPRFGMTFGTYHGSASYNTRIENFSYTPASTFVDCGLRIKAATSTITIACEPSGTLTSLLRIIKGVTTYGIVLVDTTDANASPIRTYTSSGIKALRKY